jgi:hypothetical protein
MRAKETRRWASRNAAFFSYRWCPERALPQTEIPAMIKSLPFAAQPILARR